MAVRLSILKVPHPSSTLKVSNSLSLSSILHEISLIFLPIISLHSDKCMVWLIFLFNMSYNPWVSIILNSSSMEFATFEITFISDSLFVPVKLTMTFHLSLYPISQIKLTIMILIVSFSLAVRFGLHRAQRNRDFTVSYITTVLIVIEMSLLCYNALVVVRNSTLSVIWSA